MSTSTSTSTWTKTKQDGKAAFDKGWAVLEKVGGPVNRLSNKMGCEAFCPTTLDHECDKSARILKSFCGGFYTEPTRHGSFSGPRNKPRVLVHIPQKVIQNCVGLAIFTVIRTGMWVSGAAGSGVLIARKEDGSWSPPSGLLVHTLGVGFMAGIDIYDCVVVINNRSALEAFSKVRVSLGGEVSVVAGPLGVGGILESEVTKNRKPVFSYVKSRGLYAGMQLDGTVIVERNDENARFYGEPLPMREILKGNVKTVPQETRMLMQVLREIDEREAGVQRMPETSSATDPGVLETQNMDEEKGMQTPHSLPPDDEEKASQTRLSLPPDDEEKATDDEKATQTRHSLPPDDEKATQRRLSLPPDYEEMDSTNSLYAPPSPAKSPTRSGSFTKKSPAQGSMEASFPPPLPPRTPSLNEDSEKSKME